jgi:hypothetical protein
MKPFMNIGSIPIYLLNDDFPRRAMFLTRSERSSERLRSLFIKFLRIEIKRVGNELLFVIS